MPEGSVSLDEQQILEAFARLSERLGERGVRGMTQIMNENLERQVVRRPRNLAEVAEWSAADGKFDMHLRDFLHEFARARNFSALRDEPQRLCDRFEDGGVRDAYLAATAAFLARRIEREVPRWALARERFLSVPWFATKKQNSLQLMLLLESPPEFRERNLFVSENALEVC